MCTLYTPSLNRPGLRIAVLSLTAYQVLEGIQPSSDSGYHFEGCKESSRIYSMYHDYAKLITISFNIFLIDVNVGLSVALLLHAEHTISL